MTNFKGYESKEELMELYEAAVKDSFWEISDGSDEKAIERTYDAMCELESKLRARYGMSDNDITALYEKIMDEIV